jgi:hypothetical protein
MVIECVFLEVRSVYLNIIQTIFGFKGLMCAIFFYTVTVSLPNLLNTYAYFPLNMKCLYIELYAHVDEKVSVTAQPCKLLLWAFRCNSVLTVCTVKLYIWFCYLIGLNSGIFSI